MTTILMPKPKAPPRRKPEGFGWVMGAVNVEWTVWHKGEVRALSSVIYIADEHLPPHWEWLISFSKMGRARLSNSEIAKALKDFNAHDFEEDNHESGVARKFWMAVDEKYRKPCPCKNEVLITEGEYQYSVEKNK